MYYTRVQHNNKPSYLKEFTKYMQIMWLNSVQLCLEKKMEFDM